MEQPKVYVWSPLHRKHKFVFSGKFITYLGEIIIHKCEKCGDVIVIVKQRAT